MSFYSILDTKNLLVERQASFEDCNQIIWPNIFFPGKFTKNLDFSGNFTKDFDFPGKNWSFILSGQLYLFIGLGKLFYFSSKGTTFEHTSCT